MSVNSNLESVVSGQEKRPLRPLLPLCKPVDSADRQLLRKKPELAPCKPTSLGRCGIRQCRKMNCNLSSHRHYATTIRPLKISNGQAAVLNALPPILLQNNSLLLDHSMTRIEKQIADAFPTLRFSAEKTATFRALAHHYFAHQIDLLIQLYSPQLDRRKYKQTMAEHAFSNDIFCICIMANAKIDMIMRGHIHKPDPTSELVYATVAHILRQRLSSIKQKDIDWLLVLVIALVGFDLAFGRTASLRGHHAALIHLVGLKGGLHTVGHVLPYVTNIDRFLAFFTGQYPAYLQSPLIPVPGSGDESPGPYGQAFDEDIGSRVLDAEVVDFCLDQCRLIYLMESSQISHKPHTAPAADASVLRYFLYQRDQLHSRGACLHAQYHEMQNRGTSSDIERFDTVSDSSCDDEITLSKSRCVLLATLIVQYHVLYANYYTVKGTFLADQLQSILERQSSMEWTENVDMLLWILFVMAVAVPRWENHDWVLNRIRHWLKLTSQSHQPQPGWQKSQLANLKKFVWAETKFRANFDEVCCVLLKEWS